MSPEPEKTEDSPRPTPESSPEANRQHPEGADPADHHHDDAGSTSFRNFDPVDQPKQARPGLGRYFGPLAGGALLLTKLKGFLGALKFLTFLKSGASLLLFIAVEAWAFGWPSAVVITAVLLAMSVGRLLALRLQRRQASPMVFIPFLGGGAAAKTRGDVATQDAFVSLMGPVFGGVCALGCAGLYLSSENRFWLVMASIAFMINLFQLLPAPGLAGGSIALMISPKLLLPGIAILLAVGWKSPIIWVISLLALPYAWTMFKAKPSDDPYLAAVTSADRWKYGIGLLVIALVLAGGNRWCDDRIYELRRFLG